MRRLGACSLAVFFLLFFIISPGVILAQETVAASAAPVSADQALSDQINDLRNTYRAQLETYRNNERQFAISKEQYYKIQTLASLEEAVRATREVMLSRIAVVKTYITLLKLSLLQSRGLDLAVKGQQIALIDQFLINLQKHQINVEVATDKLKLNAVTNEFKDMTPQISDLTYKSLTLIAYSNMQASYNETFLMKEQIKQKIETEETDALKVAEKKRGMDEIERNLTGVNTELTAVKSETEKPELRFSDSSYDQIVQDLGGVYGGLSRSISYLREIMNQ
jgi:hypothetical protein